MKPPAASNLVSGVLIAVAALVATPRPARADDGPAAPIADSPGVPYLWDGGALPFFWAALGGQLAIGRWVSPRSTPLWFSASEGGRPRASWEVPNWTLQLGGAATVVAIAAAGDASRWYHAKGLAESFATSMLLTQVLKVTFGRHRPDWTPADTDPGQRESFPSGHATEAFAIATYAALYLHEHAFDGMRAPGAVVGVTEGLTYAALAAGASALALERGLHNRHFVSDILVGAAIGTVTSTVFFLYQEGRYRHSERGGHSFAVVPAATGEGAIVQVCGVF